MLRLVSVIPGPFTLQAARRSPGRAPARRCSHLIDCSLLVPPRAGPDRARPLCDPETLRAFGLSRLAEADEHAGAAAAPGAVCAAGRLRAADPYGRLRPPPGRLDAEDATVHQALTWPWTTTRPPRWAWRSRWLRGGTCGPLGRGRALLRRAVRRAAAGGQEWCAGQRWLGHLAAAGAVDHAAALGHFTSPAMPWPPARVTAAG